MPVFFITVHTYRSWSEANPRGYIQRGEHGYKKPNEGLAAERSGRAKHPPTRLSVQQQQLVLDGLREICNTLEVKPYAASCTPTHWHLLAGWIEDYAALTCGVQPAQQQAKALVTRLKRVVGSKLSAHRGSTGNRWFSRGWDIEPVANQGHFDHLIEAYLPKHAAEGGCVEIWGA